MTRAITNEFSKQIALLISIYFPPEPGGGSTAAWNRAQILHKIGFYVYVLCGFPSYPSGKISAPKYRRKLFYVEEQGDFTLIRLRLLPLKTSGYMNRLILFLNFVFLSLFYIIRILKTTGKINMVYSIAPIIFSSFIGYAYSRLNKSLFVYEVSDLWPEELVIFKTGFSFFIFHVGKIVAKLSYIFPDIIVTISKLAADHVFTTYKPKAAIHVLPIGVDIDKFKANSKDSARKILIDSNLLPNYLYNKFIILYSGLISKATRVENIVQAANKLQNVETEIYFLIVGEGEEKQKLLELKSAHNIGNLIMLPFQPREIVPIIISASDICVVSLPSTPIFDVDVPTKFYEYLACCRPQIGICGGDLAKIINSNRIGFTVSDGQIDEIAKLVVSFKNSKSLISTMEKNSYALLQDYTLDALASQFKTVLEKEIKQRKTR